MGPRLAGAARNPCGDACLVGSLRPDGARHRRARRRALDQRADAHRPCGRRSGLPRRERPLPRPHDPGCQVRGASGRGPRSVVRPGSGAWRDPRVPHRHAGSEHPGPDTRDRALHRSRRLDGPRRRARRSSLARPPRAAPRIGAARARPLRRAGGGHRGRRVLRDVRRAGEGDQMRAGDRRIACGRSVSTFVPGCTRARSSSRTARSRASP